MKRIIAIASALALCLMLAACSSGNDSKGTEGSETVTMATFEKWGLSLEYPDTWEVTDPEPEETTIIEPAFDALVTINTTTFDNELTIPLKDAVVEGIEQRMKTSFPAYTIGETEVSYDGDVAIVTLPISQKETKGKISVYGVGQSAYIVAAAYGDSCSEDEVSAINCVFDSVKINPDIPVPLDDAQQGSASMTASESAEDLLSYYPYSYAGLIEALEAKGYSTEEANAAADGLDVNWDEQALEMANLYLEDGDMSAEELQEYLEFEGFTTEQASAAAAAATA